MTQGKERILVLGCSGMLGSAVYRLFSTESNHAVFGTVRSLRSVTEAKFGNADGLIESVDAGDIDSIIGAFVRARPSVVINCIGLVKQLAASEDPLAVLPINSLLPHRLGRLCKAGGARLVHVSTDCVFSGRKGGYRESDASDAEDLYGRSKYIGELTESHTVTLRTSIIGHELNTAHGLVDWFLAQPGPVKGFEKAVFSGLPTVVLAELIRDCVIPDKDLSGVWHVSSDPINKLDLLRILAEVYERSTVIVPDGHLVIDRSLDSTRFRERTGFRAAPWPALIRRMRAFA
jgi:dTDP-4-dehydrorhamnose reductase